MKIKSINLSTYKTFLWKLVKTDYEFSVVSFTYFYKERAFHVIEILLKVLTFSLLDCLTKKINEISKNSLKKL